MAYIGGKWVTVGESKGLGSKINVVSKERATAMVSERGILAIPLEMNWGADESIKVFTAQDWTRDSLYTFGYDTTAPEVRNIREMFLGGANELVIARLNGKGEKASNSICKAKYPGTRGNDLEVSVEADPDSGTIENELADISVKFTASENKVTATYSNVPDGYELVGSLVKDGVENKKAVQTVDGNQLIITIPDGAEAGEYEVKACVKSGEAVSLISTGSITVTVTPATEPVVIEKFGFVKENATLDSINPGASSAIDHDNNIFYFYFKEKPEDATNYLTVFEVDGKKYASTWSNTRGNLVGLGKGKSHNTDADFVFDTSWKKHNGTEIDVTGKTVKVSVVKFDEPVTNAKAPTGEGTEVIAPVEIDCSADKEGGNNITVQEGTEASTTAKYTSATPESFDSEVPAKFIVKTFLDGVEVDKQTVKNISKLKDNDFIVWDKTLQLEENAGEPLSGGTNSEVTNADYSDALNKLEPQVFHVLGLPIRNEELQQMFIEYTKRLRDALGIKFVTVMPPTDEPANYEGVIQVPNLLEDDDVNEEGDLIYWVAGLQAGCKVQDSCGNLDYTGAYTIDVNYTQRALENMIDNGYFAFHLARGKDRQQHVRTWVDINTLTEFGDGQNEDWTRNQTIRVIDQCCNDIAALFNNDYASRVPNTDAGRAALRTDIKTYMEELEAKGAIEAFDPSSIVIEQYDKRIVVVEVLITPVNAMEQMYMTIFIQ